MLRMLLQLDDELNVGDCLTTKGVCYINACAAQLKVGFQWSMHVFRFCCSHAQQELIVYWMKILSRCVSKHLNNPGMVVMNVTKKNFNCLTWQGWMTRFFKSLLQNHQNITLLFQNIANPHSRQNSKLNTIGATSVESVSCQDVVLFGLWNSL